MYSDHERQTHILPHALPRKMKINNRHINLKLLIICKIVTTIKKCSTDSTLVIFQLPLPLIMCFDIEQEVHYQRDLYFSSIIEPTIEYTYKNEY